MRWFLFCFGVVGVLRAQVLVNGGFEGPVLGGTLNLAGAFSLPGWSGVGPSNGGNAGLVVGVDNGLGPREGAQHFTFNGGNPSDRGWLEQSFSTVSGSTYVVSFSVGRSGGGQDLSLLATVAPSTGSGQGGVEFVAAPPAARGYADYSFSFVAGGAVSTLRFADTSGGNSISDLYLDGVSVSMSAIPEPGTWAAWAGAVAVVAAWWRRRPASPEASQGASSREAAGAKRRRSRKRAMGLYC